MEIVVSEGPWSLPTHRNPAIDLNRSIAVLFFNYITNLKLMSFLKDLALLHKNVHFLSKKKDI